MIVLRLPLPCPLNALYRAIPIRVGKRMVQKMVKSKRGREREGLIVAEIRRQLGGPGPMYRLAQVHYSIVPRDRRLPDFDAYEKQLMDCLQKAGVVANDGGILFGSKERLAPQFPGWLDVQVSEVLQ